MRASIYVQYGGWKLQIIEIYFDGASRSNPGPAGTGWVVTSGDDLHQTGNRYIGKATNNEAEYTSLILALEWLTKNYDISNSILTIKGDSQLVIKQLKGEYAVRAPNLQKLYSRSSKLLQKFKKWEAVWIPRTLNANADELANLALAGK